jgi:LAO/AO transport system kinase
MSKPIRELVDGLKAGQTAALARCLSIVEDDLPGADEILAAAYESDREAYVVGITGPPGAGKSTLTGEIARTFSADANLGVILVDPSSPFTGGALLGDRIRMSHLNSLPRTFVRSMASRGSLGGLARATTHAIRLMEAAGKDRILVETVGTGQAEVDVVEAVDTVIVVAVPGMGDEIQALKAGVLEIGDLFVVNKSDRPEADRVVRELEHMLAMGSIQKKVMKTAAREGIGVVEVAQELLSMGQALRQSGKLTGNRRERLKRLLSDELKNRWLEVLRSRMTSDTIDSVAEKVLLGQTSYPEAITSLWEAVKI